MKVLRLCFLLAMSLFMIVPFGIIAALIVEFFVNHPTVHSGFDGNPHYVTIVTSGVVCFVACGLLFWHESEKGDFVGVFIRVAVASSAWPIIRVATRQDSLAAAVPFLFVAGGVIVAGTAGMWGFLKPSRFLGYLLYGPAAAAILVFGVFLHGERLLQFERSDGQVACRFETCRWFGFYCSDAQRLVGVTGSIDKHESDQFDHISADGRVLQSASGEELFVPDSRFPWAGLSHAITSEVDDFLKSTTPSLHLVEATPALPMSVIMLMAAATLYFGLTCDPLVPSAVAGRDRAITMCTGRIFGVLCVLCFVQLAWPVVGILRASKYSQQYLSEKFAEFDVRDFEIRGQVVNTDGWYARAGDARFGDAELVQAIPHLKNAQVLWLDLSNTQVTDAGLKSLRKSEAYVRILNLRRTGITDAAWLELERMSMDYLDVRDTQIRKQQLKATSIPWLKAFWFTDPEFTKSDIPVLFEFRDLKYVFIDQAQLSPEDLDFWDDQLRMNVDFTNPNVAAEIDEF